MSLVYQINCSECDPQESENTSWDDSVTDQKKLESGGSVLASVGVVEGIQRAKLIGKSGENALLS